MHPLVAKGNSVRGGPAWRARSGFSLIDVLVTLAVMAVLISLLAPTLSSVRETAHQVICRSNVRQLGMGIAWYADDHQDRMPPSEYALNQPWETNTLRYGPRPGRALGGWDGLGLLYSEEYLVAPKLYYCPSHKGSHPFINYEQLWASEVGLLRGNYQYRGRGPVAGGAPGQTTDFLSKIEPGAALITDSIRSQTDFNHQVGSNVFRAINVVAWFNDREGRFLQSLPKEGETPGANQFQTFWDDLDNH